MTYMLDCTITSVDILKVILFIKYLLNILFIVIPIGLILMLSIDFAKSVTSGDEQAMKKNFNIAIKRLIMVVALFFVPTIVNLCTSILGDLGVSWSECYYNLSPESIESLAEENAKNLLTKLSTELSYSSYNEASEAISKITNSSIKSQLEEQLKSYSDEVDANNKPTEDPTIEAPENNNTSSTSSTNSGTSVTNRKVYYIGDSRTYGLYLSITPKDNEIFYYKGGQGISWFKSSALPYIKSELDKNPTGAVVINMGTNDLSDISARAKNYATIYNDLAKTYKKSKIVVMSVTEINDSKAANNDYDVRNSMVIEFNKVLKENIKSPVKYCNVYEKIKGTYETSDGIHYTVSTYNEIYNAIQDCLK